MIELDLKDMPHGDGLFRGFADIHSNWMITRNGSVVSNRFFKTWQEAFQYILDTKDTDWEELGEELC